MAVLVATTVAPHKVDGTETIWLTHAEAMRDDWPEGVEFFCAAEVDGRGLPHYGALLERLEGLDGTVWTFGIDKAPRDTQPFEVTGVDRLIRICTGRNLAAGYAAEAHFTLDRSYSHVLFIDTDTQPPPDVISKLVEVDRPLVFGDIPTYDLDGPRDRALRGDTRRHWSSAGLCLVQEQVLGFVRWGTDPAACLTDDPCFSRNVELVGRALGDDWAPVTRHDCVGRHYPDTIAPLEARGADLNLYR